MMKWTVVSVIACVVCLTCAVHGAKTSVTFENMKVTYRGNGIVSREPIADNVWAIRITGISDATTSARKVRNTLTIKPLNKSRNSVYIDTISADGPLRSITIKLPPGLTIASCVRNIDVDGFVKTVRIIGGDLGSSDGHEGKCTIKGYVKTLLVQGRKYNVPSTDLVEYWGGNIWCDLSIDGGATKIIAKGGDIHYDAAGGVLGLIELGAELRLLASDGVIVKTNRRDKTTKVLFGGSINTEVYVDGWPVRQARSKGGTIRGGMFYCREVKRLQAMGQGVGDPPPRIPLSDQGIHCILVETVDPLLDFDYSSAGQINVKNGSVRDALFAVKGHVKRLAVQGETVAGMGDVSNVIMRAGYEGVLSDNVAPSIVPTSLQTSTVADTELRIPFTVNSVDAGEELFVRLHYRGPMRSAYISNYYGEAYYGTDQWRVTSYPATGMVVWVSDEYDQGAHSNITVRVRDDAVPNMYDDLSMIVTVVASNVAPEITLTPPDNPRIFSIHDQMALAWTVTVFDLNLADTLTLSIEGDQFGLVTQRVDHSTWYAWTTNTPIGSYSNLVFRVTDPEGLSDAISLIVVVTSNKAPVVTTTLTTNVFEWAVSNMLSFSVVATDDETNTLTFPRPPELPADASYVEMSISNVIAATNHFEWTPGTGDAGTHTWTFMVGDSSPAALTGMVQVVVTVTNGSARAAFRIPSWSIESAPIGSNPGNIGNVSVVGDVLDSMLVSGAKDDPPLDWANASYLGRIKNVKIQGQAVNNTLVSSKRIKIWQGDTFNFVTNEVWVNNHRATDDSQK
jgi:hypothetical protein